MTNVVALVCTVAATIVALGVISRAGRTSWAFLRRLGRVVDDWLGEPAHGVEPARPGVLDRISHLETLVVGQLDAFAGRLDQVAARLERLDALDQRLALVEAQLRPSGDNAATGDGTTLRDAVDKAVAAPTPEDHP